MTKITDTNDLNEKILAPLIKYCAENRGALTAVTKLFNKGLARPTRMTNLQRWLNSDRSKSVPPSAGSLLRLLECWRSIRGEPVLGHPDQTVFCAANGCESSRDGRNCKRCGRTF